MTASRSLVTVALTVLLGLVALIASAWIAAYFGTRTAVTGGLIAAGITLASGSRIEISIHRHRTRTERPL